MTKSFTSAFYAFLFTFFSFLFCQTLSAQQIAFPGAEGAGKFTSGGRGTSSVATTVYEVTNLNDDGLAGSLRYAINASATYKTIVFRVSGTIHLNSKLNIRSNTTIAGQTAPGDGICLADYPVVISGDNVIIRYIRCRMGDKNQIRQQVDGAGSDDALGNLGNKKLIIDHCSVSWSTDEALTVYRGDSVTLQWNIISEPLNYSYHFEAGDSDFEHHGYGGIWGSKHGSFHHNLIAHCKNRTPRFAGISTYSPAVQGAEMCDFRNNVLYNWGINNVYGGEGGYYNVVNNYYKYGPSTTSRKYQVVAVDYGTDIPYAQYYLTGNYVDGSPTNTANNWKSVTMKSGNMADTSLSKVTTPFDLPAITTETAENAYTSVLAGAGASFPKRDTLDERIINDVKNRTGQLIDVQGGYPHGTAYEETVNAWPALTSSAAPTDSDHDGMPDSWETQNSLNPNNAADRNTYDASGYTMLEVYLNSLVAGTSSSPDPDPAPGTDSGTSSAVWPLQSDQSVNVTGNITAASQTMDANMSVKNYNSFVAGSANDVNTFQPYTAQRVLPNGGNLSTYVGWPSGQTAPVSNQWVQYAVAPVSGKDLTVNNISFDFGPAGSTNAMKVNIYYSLDGFQTEGTLLNGSPVTLPAYTSGDNSYTTVSYPSLNIKVTSGNTLTVRVYPWWPNTASSTKYLVEKNVTISGTTASVMPLKLISFKAAVNQGLQKAVSLNWVTVNEVNTKSFEIERGINDHFWKIGELASGNTKETQYYSFIDNAPLEGVAYYRLKMIDQDGQFTYSPVIAAELPGAELSLYPNPAAGELMVSFQSGSTTGTLAVSDAFGRVVLTEKISKGMDRVPLNLDKLAPGYYILTYTSGSKRISRGFLKN